MLPDFTAVCERYEREYAFPLLHTDAQGRIIDGEIQKTDCECGGQADLRRKQAAERTRYWGNVVIDLCCETGYAMWGVPILTNNKLTGALIVQGIDLESDQPDFHESVQKAADALLDFAVEGNLINRAEITLARQRALQEQDHFLAIEATKRDIISDDLRSIYITEEPGLLSAIKQGQIKEARSILNRILVGIYGLGGDRMEVLKSSILELVVMMSRASVEAGAEPAAVLGRNYQSLTELSRIDDEEDLSTWVRRMLETLIESIHRNQSYPNSVLMMKAIKHMQDNLHLQLRRNDVARIAGVSPSHFSKLVTEQMGRSFSQLLAQMRVSRAKELLLQTNRSLTQIALDCGFFDQSHLSRTFRPATGLSPGDYRKRGR